jgi:nitric oxide reductase activation protein
MRMLRRIAMCAAAGGLMLALGSAGQGVQGSGSRTVDQTTQVGPIVPSDAKMDKLENEREKLADVERQKKLVADTAKLLELANELKAAVDKSNKDTLSLDVVRKADAIEKLAHSVKEGMKGN